MIQHGHRELCATAIAVAEIIYSMERRPEACEGGHCGRLQSRRVQSVRQILPVDAAAATVYAKIVDCRDRRGAPISGF
ncbi:MAG: hypothetical protein M3N98_14480, partial [Actinomycetota bacterium]|nr:hypothetical protein [Actinomycetota bacterium]